MSSRKKVIAFVRSQCYTLYIPTVWLYPYWIYYDNPVGQNGCGHDDLSPKHACIGQPGRSRRSEPVRPLRLIAIWIPARIVCGRYSWCDLLSIIVLQCSRIIIFDRRQQQCIVCRNQKQVFATTVLPGVPRRCAKVIYHCSAYRPGAHKRVRTWSAVPDDWFILAIVTYVQTNDSGQCWRDLYRRYICMSKKK